MRVNSPGKSLEGRGRVNMYLAGLLGFYDGGGVID